MVEKGVNIMKELYELSNIYSEANDRLIDIRGCLWPGSLKKENKWVRTS